MALCVIARNSVALCVIARSPEATKQSMLTKTYYVYIMSNRSNSVIYTGVTNNLPRRVDEHKNKSIKGFTSNYNVNKLVYFEEYQDVESAVAREKQIKAGSRARKLVLINVANPEWKDLFAEIASSTAVSSQ